MKLARPPNVRNRHDKRWSLCASLLLHALLLLVLGSRQECPPLVGRQTRLDILWLTMSHAAAASPAPLPAAKLTEVPRRIAEKPPGKKPQRPVRPGQEAPRAGAFLASEAPPAAPRSEKRRAARALAGVPDQEPEQAPVRIATAAASIPQKAPQPAALPPRPARETVAKPAKVERESLTAAQPSPQPPVREATRSDTSEPAASPRPAPEPQAAPPREAPRTPAPADTPAAPQKSPEERGLVIASPRGDLKLLITGAELKLSVQFREYPRARRNSTPPMRSQAGRQQEIVPLWATVGEKSREAVIEKASEGVYLFSIEPAGGSPAQGSFTLKVLAAGKAEKVTRLGSRTITGKTVLARILMPEAVLWDDENAFTGSLQDSDSTTKFNSETGLYWKEYDH